MQGCSRSSPGHQNPQGGNEKAGVLAKLDSWKINTELPLLCVSLVTFALEKGKSGWDLQAASCLSSGLQAGLRCTSPGECHWTALPSLQPGLCKPSAPSMQTPALPGDLPRKLPWPMRAWALTGLTLLTLILLSSLSMEFILSHWCYCHGEG